MDFFAQQDMARRHTARLVFMFILAVLLIVAAVNLAFIITYLSMFEGDTRKILASIPPTFYLVVTVGTLAVISIGSVVRIVGVASGGHAVARMLGARQVDSASKNPGERRLLNVVEEMAIASGIAVPQVFVMDDQPSINAFAAGFSPNEAAIVVTQGSLQKLNRDELQGVIGHEFSHILNSDMRLNTRLIGILGGILVLTTLGRMLARSSRGSKGNQLALLGLALIVIGYVGVFFGRVIQAGVSRQREFLADAASLQFTRNPDGIGGALAKIGQSPDDDVIKHPRAHEASHMFFSETIRGRLASLLATHPPVGERLERIYGRPVEIDSFVAQSGPLPPLTPDTAVSGFASHEETGRSPNGRKTDPAEKDLVAATPNAVTASVGAATPQHVNYAAAMLDSLPSQLRESIRATPGARAAMLGLVFSLKGPVNEAHMRILGAGGEDAEAIAGLAANIQGLGKKVRLPLIALATPVLKSMPLDERASFLALLRQLIEADRRVTLDEFMLLTLLEVSLDERAGRAVPEKYHALEQLAADVQQVLSLVAHTADEDSADAFGKGVEEISLPLVLLDKREIKLTALRESLDRLNQLAPLKKPALIKALAKCVIADGKLNLGEAELLRTVCATLDSPMPPFIEAMPCA